MGGTFQSTLPTRGSDPQGAKLILRSGQFQSTLPTRGSDRQPRGRNNRKYKHFNPRSPRGGATFSGAGIAQHSRISIHAPHEGERQGLGDALNDIGEFQSTLPTRGSDKDSIDIVISHNHFNPRSPRGGATTARQIKLTGDVISIHAPHEGERRLTPRKP